MITEGGGREALCSCREYREAWQADRDRKVQMVEQGEAPGVVRNGEVEVRGNESFIDSYWSWKKTDEGKAHVERTNSNRSSRSEGSGGTISQMGRPSLGPRRWTSR